MSEFSTESRLEALLTGLDYEVINKSTDIEIKHLIFDSRKVEAGDLFICIVGAAFDAHTKALEVAEKGASAIVISKDIEITGALRDITVIKVPDTRLALACMSAAYFGHPANKLFTIGVTGTKGKTSVTSIMKQILDNCGINTGLIGTNGIFISGERIVSDITTPESYDIHRYLRKMVDEGCRCAIVEVSSQALKLDRVGGIIFDVGVFTNMGKDHLGGNEHADMAEYIACKGKLLKQCKVGIVNADSDYLDEVLDGHTCTLETYGIHNPSDYMAKDMVYNDDIDNILTSFNIVGKVSMSCVITMPGEFSVSNALCAVATLSRLGLDEDKLKEALRDAQIAGRMEIMPITDDIKLVFDFAHNAISLKNILTTLRSFKPKRLIAMFGLDGDRTRVRRYEMGYIAGKMADLTVLTSTIPRSEKPEDIIAEIAKGTIDAGGEYISIPKRKEAIRWMVDHSKPGDIIMLVGHVDDRQETLDAIANRHPVES